MVKPNKFADLESAIIHEAVPIYFTCYSGSH